MRDQFVQCIYICAESLATITTSFQQTAQQFGIQMEENLEKATFTNLQSIKKTRS